MLGRFAYKAAVRPDLRIGTRPQLFLSANGSAARRGELMAGVFASRVALYNSGGIIETNQVRYKKNPSRAIALDEFQQF